MKRTILASMLALAMGMSGVGAAAQLGGVTDATKAAGKTTVHTTKKAGKATVDTTEKAVGTAGSETKKAGETTASTVTGNKYGANCADGTRQTAKSHSAAKKACGNHGGVAKY